MCNYLGRSFFPFFLCFSISVSGIAALLPPSCDSGSLCTRLMLRSLKNPPKGRQRVRSGSRHTVIYGLFSKKRGAPSFTFLRSKGAYRGPRVLQGQLRWLALAPNPCPWNRSTWHPFGFRLGNQQLYQISLCTGYTYIGTRIIQMSHGKRLIGERQRRQK